MTSRSSGLTAARSGAAAGFTLLEMIVVLVVLALVAGVVMSRGPVRSRGLTVRAAVADVVATLRGARGRAIAASRPVLVVVNGAEGRMSVDGQPVLSVPPGMALAAASGLGTPPTSRLTGIRFSPDGSSSGGRILLADGTRRVLVAVDWLTGRVSAADAQ